MCYYLWGEGVGTFPYLIELGSPQNTNVSIGPSGQIQLPAVSCAHEMYLSEESSVLCVVLIHTPEATPPPTTTILRKL